MSPTKTKNSSLWASSAHLSAAWRTFPGILAGKMCDLNGQQIFTQVSQIKPRRNQRGAENTRRQEMGTEGGGTCGKSACDQKKLAEIRGTQYLSRSIGNNEG